MLRINNDIKSRQFKRVYLLYGDERYLLIQYKSKLVKALVNADDNMNFAHFEGKELNIGQMIDFAETMPFLAEYRVVLCDDSHQFKSSDEKLVEYIAQIPDTTILIFTEEEVDKRSKLFKAVNEVGTAVEFKTPNEADLDRWILGRIKRENKDIRREALELFKNYVGSDMGNMDREIDKLITYCLECDVIEASHVKEICVEQPENKIFEMVNAIIERRRVDAMDMYYDLLTLKEPPMRILYMIARQYNILLQIKDLQKKGRSYDDMAPIIGMSSWAIKNNAKRASRVSQQTIVHMLEYATLMEEKVKSGNMLDTIAVESVIVEGSKDLEYK